ncbi:hypothetical protein ABTX61_40340 [Amycolatopsis japonica]|uniref:hypothetical protein n=1 Tax=Amycolatopsis japonica TaxID=208439 RepID=UPI00331D6C27
MPEPWRPRWGFLFLYFLVFVVHAVFAEWDETAAIGAPLGFVATLVLVFVPGLPLRRRWAALRFTIRRRAGVLDVVFGPWTLATATLDPDAGTTRGWVVLEGAPAKFVIEDCPDELAESLRGPRRMWVVGDAHYGEVPVCADGGRAFTTAAVRFR